MMVTANSTNQRPARQRMLRVAIVAVGFAAAPALSGCASDSGSDVSAEDVGEAVGTVLGAGVGVVVGANMADGVGSVGALVGGAVGSVAGNLIGADIGRHLDEQERERVEEASTSVLTTDRDRKEWSSPTRDGVSGYVEVVPEGDADTASTDTGRQNDKIDCSKPLSYREQVRLDHGLEDCADSEASQPVPEPEPEKSYTKKVREDHHGPEDGSDVGTETDQTVDSHPDKSGSAEECRTIRQVAYINGEETKNWVKMCRDGSGSWERV